MRCIFTISLLFIFSNAFSQDISGEWKGKIFHYPGSLYNDTTSITLQIIMGRKGKLTGYSTSYFNNFLFAEAFFEGKVDSTGFYVEEKRITNSGGGRHTNLLLQRFEFKFNNNIGDQLIGNCICIKPADKATNIPCIEDMIIQINKLLKTE